MSTGNLIRHLKDVHNLQESKQKNVQQRTLKDTLMNVTRKPETTSKKDGRWLLARDLALWFCRALLPFDLVGNEGTVDFMKVRV